MTSDPTKKNDEPNERRRLAEGIGLDDEGHLVVVEEDEENTDEASRGRTRRSDGHATGMAGEFFVMEQLFRLGHLPALTLGNAKMVDIFVKTVGGTYEVSVKAVRGGGKWGVGKAATDYTGFDKLIFVFLLYRDFANVTERPAVYVVPAPKVQELKRHWIGDLAAVYYSHKRHSVLDQLAAYKDYWSCFPSSIGP